MASFAALWKLRGFSYTTMSVIIGLLMPSQGALAAPPQLYGKSVIVTWQEDRQQKFAGEDQMRSVAAAGEFDAYVSDAGRTFSRVRLSVANRRGKLKTGNRDAVQGEGTARSFSFHGSTMNASMPRGGAGAMQILVTFDSGFGSCSAQVVAGKATGARFSRAKSMINGNQVDLYSIKTSGEGCRVQNGNVFGN
jgi:hypothetical protein